MSRWAGIHSVFRMGLEQIEKTGEGIPSEGNAKSRTEWAKWPWHLELRRGRGRRTEQTQTTLIPWKSQLYAGNTECVTMSYKFYLSTKDCNLTTIEAWAMAIIQKNKTPRGTTLLPCPSSWPVPLATLTPTLPSMISFSLSTFSQFLSLSLWHLSFKNHPF